MSSDKPRYLKQVIVVRKDLSMPTGKLAAMVAHASMSFLLSKIADSLKESWLGRGPDKRYFTHFHLSANEAQWLTELDPGLEETGQVSMAKIVLRVDSETELLAIETKAKGFGLNVHRVIDSGHSHNPPGTLTCVAIGPHWPEELEPITGGLKVYR